MTNLNRKEYTVKMYKKKAGSNPIFSHDFFGGFDKKEAFQAGRDELIKFAEFDRNGNNDEEIDDCINSINNGRDNYYYDQTIWSFKVFSKKAN